MFRSERFENAEKRRCMARRYLRIGTDARSVNLAKKTAVSISLCVSALVVIIARNDVIMDVRKLIFNKKRLNLRFSVSEINT